MEALASASGKLGREDAESVMAGIRDTCGLSSDARAADIAADVLEKLLPDETVKLPEVECVGGGVAYRALKRAFDVCACALALVVMAIPMLVIAARIRRESPGPAIYAQEREGLGGRPFKLYKFRSMYADAEERGAHLRRTRLDEIPQFWNVVKCSRFEAHAMLPKVDGRLVIVPLEVYVSMAAHDALIVHIIYISIKNARRTSNHLLKQVLGHTSLSQIWKAGQRRGSHTFKQAPKNPQFARCRLGGVRVQLSQCHPCGGQGSRGRDTRDYHGTRPRRFSRS